jgi:hypothetical protein
MNPFLRPLLAITACFAILAASPAQAIDKKSPVPEPPGRVFHATFDGGSADADEGGELLKAKPYGGKKIQTEDGLRGLAFLGGGSADSAKGLLYGRAGILSFESPGTIILWFKPVGWKTSEQIFEALAADAPATLSFEERARDPLWATSYTSNRGSLGIQRLSSPIRGSKDTLMFWIRTDRFGTTEVMSFDWSPNDWGMLAISWSPTDVQIHLNGELLKGFTLPEDLRDSMLSGDFQVGGSSSPTLYDEVSVYNRALSSEEILSLYNALRAGK